MWRTSSMGLGSHLFFGSLSVAVGVPVLWALIGLALLIVNVATGAAHEGTGYLLEQYEYLTALFFRWADGG